MPGPSPLVYLARHGETAWTISGQHTGLTDVPLTEKGARDAVRLGDRLRKAKFQQVFTSPLQRARRTCELAGYGSDAQVDPDLVEWDYGDFEGLRSSEIKQKNPDWLVFREGCPNGETVEAIGARADRVIKQVREVGGDVLLFSSGHFLRVLTARWLGLPASAGQYFLLSTASLSILGYEHNNLAEPVILLWNEVD